MTIFLQFSLKFKCLAIRATAISLLVALANEACASQVPHSVSFRSDNLSIISRGIAHRFTVEIAETQEQQQQGLMLRTMLQYDHGMLFIAKTDRIFHMWMKDTKIPLDMLFIDDNGTILDIKEQLTPDSTRIITDDKSVRAVLELPGGTARKDHIAVGDRVKYPTFHSEPS